MATNNMQDNSKSERVVMVRVMIGSSYIQRRMYLNNAKALVTAARTLGFRASYEFNFTGCTMASPAQNAKLFATLNSAAREQGYASFSYEHH